MVINNCDLPTHTPLTPLNQFAFSHIPVLGEELIRGLDIQAGGNYLDLTVGGGGHSRLILQAADNTKVMAVDQDLDALTAAKTRLSEFGDRVDFLHTNFVNFPFSPNTYDGIS